MIKIEKYSQDKAELWNQFNNEGKNSLFMMNRNYMDYHGDRFCDHSLMIFNDDDLLALFPACKIGKKLASHAGLTFGGFLTDEKMKQTKMNECFKALIDYSKSEGFENITYKTIPHIYHLKPAEEDRYTLYTIGARLVTVDASTYINLKAPIKMSKGRKAQISRAKREGVEISLLTEYEDYDTFINLLNVVLQSRHNTYAVHTSHELKMLHDRFPNNIHLFAAIREGRMIAGTVIYEYSQVIHTQYMAANEEGRKIGALDLAVDMVIEKYKKTKLWLDFGISTEHNRIYLNEGLIAQKEGFGGRTGVYEIWEIAI